MNNEQREIIYSERRRVLDGENMRDVIMKMISDTAENVVDMCISDDHSAAEWNIAELNQVLIPIFPMQPIELDENQQKHFHKADLKQMIKQDAVKLYEAKEAEFVNPEQIREIERVVLLKIIDKHWMDHIDDMDQLRQGIGLQSLRSERSGCRVYVWPDMICSIR